MTLVLAAVVEELGDLADLGDRARAVGVGPVVSAARTAALLARRAPERVVLIGTAGAYAGGPPIGAAVASSRLGLSFGLDALGLGYTPLPPPDLDGDVAMIRALGLPQRPVLTVGAITTDPQLAARLGQDWAVEHLEAYAVGLACREAGVPFVAVLGISNVVGPDAHAQWLAHRDAAQRAAREAVRPLL